MPVKVRGACKAGHVTETTAPKGRVTWNGPCSHEGCDLTLVARRVPRDRVPAPAHESEKPSHGSDTPPEQAKPEGHESDAQYPYVEVDNYGQLPEHGRGDALTVEPDSGGGEPAGGPAGPPADEQPDPVTDEPRRTLAQRLRDRSARHRAVPYQHPLL